MKVPWVILGHSERRSLCGETNEVVGAKASPETPDPDGYPPHHRHHPAGAMASVGDRLALDLIACLETKPTFLLRAALPSSLRPPQVSYALTHGLSVIACIGETLPQRQSGQLWDIMDDQMKAVAANVLDWTRVVIAYEPVWCASPPCSLPPSKSVNSLARFTIPHLPSDYSLRSLAQGHRHGRRGLPRAGARGARLPSALAAGPRLGRGGPYDADSLRRLGERRQLQGAGKEGGARGNGV